MSAILLFIKNIFSWFGRTFFGKEGVTGASIQNLLIVLLLGGILISNISNWFGGDEERELREKTLESVQVMVKQFENMTAYIEATTKTNQLLTDMINLRKEQREAEITADYKQLEEMYQVPPPPKPHPNPELKKQEQEIDKKILENQIELNKQLEQNNETSSEIKSVKEKFETDFVSNYYICNGTGLCKLPDYR